MRNDEEAQSALKYLNLSFFQYLNLSWANQLLAFLAEKSYLIYKVYKEND